MPKTPVPLRERFWKHVLQTETCWLWRGALGTHGYGVCSPEQVVHNPRRDSKRLVHRVAWELMYGAIPSGCVITRICDNKLCVRPAHLLLRTKYKSIHDARKKGQLGLGSAKKNSKLTESQVKEILALKGKLPQRTIAREYHISASVIQNIHERKAWKHVTL